MEKLTFSILIKASKQKVWETMLNQQTYKEWTKIFNPEGGSYYEGSWDAGSIIHFIGPDKDGNLGGMYSKIAENKPYDFISIQHLGEIINGEEKPWPLTNGEIPYENYTFKETDGGTEVLVELDTDEDFKKMFQDM